MWIMVWMDGDQELLYIWSKPKFLNEDFKLKWSMIKAARTTEVSDINNSNTSWEML